ncbi:Gamma-glutamyltranspeptidase 1 [Diplonema papillatum]|nr:Gamma-glutamyltranspeptidase 1 [Diplonema papillatum]
MSGHGSNPLSGPYTSVDVNPESKRERFETSCGKTLDRVLYGVLLVSIVMLVVVLLTYEKDCDDCSRGKSRQTWVDAESASFEHAAVASDVFECNVMGTSVMQVDGGNAVDAAVVVALCICVRQPSSSGIGGGAGALVRAPGEDPVLWDCRETAPAAASEDMYGSGEHSSTVGAMAGAVPAELHCLHGMHQRYGSLAWQLLVASVAALARNFSVTKSLEASLESDKEPLAANAYLKSVFFEGDAPKKEGDFVQWPALAATLQAVADDGIGALYGGSVGESFVADVQAAGGILTAEDLAAYAPVERTPDAVFYKGYQIVSAGLPFGGPVLLQTLNVLERYDLGRTFDGGFFSPEAQHLMVESFKFAYANRLGMGDPAFVEGMDDVVKIALDKQHAGGLRERINRTLTFPPEYYQDLFPVDVFMQDDHGTAHLNVMDSQGLSVSMTSTVNLAFGSKWASPSTGIILNNEMDDFSQPGRNNSFGYPPSPSNYIAPGKRPLSSMAPTLIVADGRVVQCVGAAGGSRIITATAQVVLNTLEYAMAPGAAVGAPRLHDQLLPPVTGFEANFPGSVVDGLAAMRHNMTAFPGVVGVATTILADRSDPERTVLTATTDRRKAGGVAKPFGY